MKKPQTKNIKKNSKFISKILELDRAFIVFGLIYLPITLLFLDNGTLAEVTLLIFTILMFTLGAVLISGFILFLSKSANERSANMGSVMMMYVLNMLIPLIVFKFLFYTILKLLPVSHDGFLCDLKHLTIDMYRIFQPQDTLNLIILFSFALITFFTVKSVNK